MLSHEPVLQYFILLVDVVDDRGMLIDDGDDVIISHQNPVSSSASIEHGG